MRYNLKFHKHCLKQSVEHNHFILCGNVMAVIALSAQVCTGYVLLQTTLIAFAAEVSFFRCWLEL